MSLESYKKAIEAQRKFECEDSPKTKPSNGVIRQSSNTECVYVESKPRERRSGCLYLFILFVTLLIVAAIKNPSESEGTDMVKKYIYEKVNDSMRNKMTIDDSDGLDNLFSTILSKGLSTLIIEFVSDINVNDFVIFSTFECTICVDDFGKTSMSGIILYGKIILLTFDTNLDNLNWN